MCDMTFCQWARRFLVLLFIGLATWQGIVAIDAADGHRAPHLIAMLAFFLAMAAVLVFDWWWESRS